MKRLTLTIDGNTLTCPPGISILEAAGRLGIQIPTLCHHPELKPAGRCRICLVEDENSDRLAASCITPVEAGMLLRTDSPRVLKHRRNIVRLMMSEHPESCLVCGKGNRCRLRQVAAGLGVGAVNLYWMPNVKPLENANPFIIRDLSKCILCGQCVRADHELVVVGAIDDNHRGFSSRPSTLNDLPLEKSNCTFCGTCVAVCPTGALSAKSDVHYEGSPEREAFSVCGRCAAGCALRVGAVADRIVDVNPAARPDTVNGVTLCARGRFPYTTANTAQRLTTPCIRVKGDLKPASWDTAITFVSDRLSRVKAVHGPQSLAFLGSLKCTNEENYLFQKIARVLLGTNNVDNGGCLLTQSFLDLIDEYTDGGYRINPIAWLEKRAQMIFVIGANAADAVPVVNYALKRAACNGVPLVTVSFTPTELRPFSSLWLRTADGSEADLINGLAALICRQGGQDTAYIDHFTNGFRPYCDYLAALDPDRISATTGVSLETLQAASDQLSGKKIAVVAGRDVLMKNPGRRIMSALFNFSLMTGSLGGIGAGFYLLGVQNNQIGAYDMGAVPNALPGRKPLFDQAARMQWEKVWETKISPEPGLTADRMIKRAAGGALKAMYIMGDNPLQAYADQRDFKTAMANLDLIVLQDTHENEICKWADVVLPGSLFTEKGGSFTNLEGRVQPFAPVVAPRGQALPDWEILSRLATAMGYPVHYDSYEMIQREIRHLVPMYAALNSEKPIWIEETGQKKLFHGAGSGDSISFIPME
jgi:formate dehydrogenase (NADP+) alpha subunit